LNQKKKTCIEPCISGGKLTKTQKEILILLTQEFLTVKQIANRRQTSQEAVYQQIRKLKKLGILNNQYKVLDKTLPTTQETSIRLHGEEYNIKVLWRTDKYKELVGKVINIDGNTVKIHRDTINIFSNYSFYGSTAQKCDVKAMKYWTRFIRRLESDFKVILLKNRSQNIKRVAQHYADEVNGIAVSAHKENRRIRLYATEDGKLWFETDKSYSIEGETRHKETASEDMDEVVSRMMNDWRDNRPPTNSEIMRMLKLVIETNRETAAGLNTVVQLMNQQTIKPIEGDKWQREIREYTG